MRITSEYVYTTLSDVYNRKGMSVLKGSVQMSGVVMYVEE